MPFDEGTDIGFELPDGSVNRWAHVQNLRNKGAYRVHRMLDAVKKAKFITKNRDGFALTPEGKKTLAKISAKRRKAPMQTSGRLKLGRCYKEFALDSRKTKA